ncbi:MAG: Brp/Blh family beta-carotene 15,15'-dioxygenase [Chthoniobacterales bacterium]
MNEWFPAFQRRHTIAVVILLTIALAASPFLPTIPLATQLTMLAATVVIFGLPHGALDLNLVRGATSGSRFTLATAVGLYLLAAGIVLALWVFAPVIALFGFLFIAVIHFGLGDTEDLNGPQRAVEAVARGGFAGIAPIVFHPSTTRDLFALLVGPNSTAALYSALAAISSPATLVWGLCLVGALLWRALQRRSGWCAACAELILTTAIFAVFHPLAAFLLYFCFVHSVRHIADLGAARFPESGARAGRWLICESLPFTVATILLAAVFWLVFARSAAYDQTMIRTIFWGLSVLTVPHMILTAWWHWRGDPTPGDLFARHV